MRGIWARVGVAALAATLFIPVIGITGAHALGGPCDPPSNPIVCENSKPGVPQGYWQVQGAGDPGLQGFGTSISVEHGDTIGFKVTSVSTWHYDILRLGWYGGSGARLIAQGLTPQAAQPQAQPPCVTDANIGLVDCGNWDLSASYQVPADAVSGVYIALMTRDDTGGQSHIVFVVRDDGSHSAMVVQTSDTTWQAYNPYGGFSLYQGSNAAHRAYKVSYNRPFITVQNDSRNWWTNAELPMWQYLERNGYDISYISGIDTDQRGSLLLNHKVFIDAGHDEYWSGTQRANVDAARDAGVNIASFSGNTAYWKTRYEPSTDGTNTPYRTLVTYKESLDNAVTDPASPTWTGLWRDTRFSPPEDGGHPENALLGQNSTSICCEGTMTVPAADGQMRLWRNTAIANLAPGTTHDLTVGSLGYEFDTDVDNGFQPAGLIRASTTTLTEPSVIQDFSQTTGAATVTHHLTEYRAPSGALVFDAGTINWSFTLMGNKTGDPADPNAQQATVNVFADMGVQPATPDATLAPAAQSTDTTAPTSTITSPVPATVIAHGTTVTVSGTASDAGGGRVAGVEVSTDGGTTWHPATGRTQWSYSWLAAGDGPVNVKTRAVDDSGNLETPSAGANVTVNCPCTMFSNSTPAVPAANDATGVEVGMRFHATTNGYISGVRFYKGTTNTGVHIGNLWTTTGTNLATATFTNESASGWQQVNFASAVAVTANTDYVVSYHTNVGRYAVDARYFYTPHSAAPLYAPASSAATPNGVYAYGSTTRFPTLTSGSSNYWVDVVFTTDQTPPSVLSTTPSNGSTGIAPSATVNASFTKPIVGSSASLVVKGPDNAIVPGVVSVNPANTMVTLTPSSPMDPLTTYTATVSGAVDAGGNPMSAPYTWSFTTTSFAPCPCSVFAPTATPQNPAASDSHSTELGMKFRADANGYITGVRFYKGATNTGVHTGTLWSSSGTQLATATFSGESATGWQQVNFSRWVAVTANTTYVVSYHTNVGHYANNSNAFSGGVDNPPVHALANGVDGPNGVFAYASGTTFPATSGNNVNYWVDVVYQLTNVAPSVTTTTPANGSTGVATSTSVTASFGKTVQGSSAQMTLVDGSGVAVPATVAFDSVNNAVTLTPATPLNQTTTYTATVNDVTDSAGVPMSAPYTWTFTTAGSTSCPCSIFSPTANPSTATDAKAVEVGVKFRSDTSGYVKSVRFFKGATNTGVHIGNLWTSTGTRLATATFTNETATGWQQVDFPTPVLINANTTYVASYHTNVGHYSATTGGLTNAVDAPPLHALANGVDGSNAVFLYGAASAFPTAAANGTNYWVDVVFDSGPQIVARTPYPNATAVARTTTATVTFSKVVDPASIGFTLVDGSSQPVAGTTTYDAPSQTATFTPSAPLNPLTNYTATVSGAVDGNGLTMATPYTWSFTSAALPVNVTDSAPAVNAIDIAPSAAPTVTFGEAVVPSTVSFTVHDATNHLVAGSLDFSAANTVAWFTPTAPLAAGTTYSVVVSGAGTADLKALPAPYAWSFTTTAPPAVTSRVPAPNSSGISLGTSITINFSRPVVVDSPAIAMVDGSGNPVSGTMTLDGTHTVATFAPDAPLAPATIYSVTVSGATSLGGAVMTPATRTFTTAARPTISTQTPAPSAADVARGTTVAVGFSEAVTGATVVVTDSASNVIAGSTAYNVATNTATFTPSGLLNQETTFTVTVSGATNVAGAQMLAASWSFTTTAPPAVTSKTPAPSATGVALATTIVAGFDRAVVAGSTSFRLADAGGNTVAGTTNLDGEGAAATFTPTAALLPATTYTVTVSGSGSSGGAIMAPVSWIFTTAARPTITSKTPAAGATAVDVNTTVAAGFSQPVTGQTIVVTDPSSAVVAGTSVYDPETNTATFTPAAPFDAAVTYSVTVSGATNDAGATMLPVSWSFATAIPPSVTSQTPAPGAAAVGLGSTVSAGFDRAVTNGSTNFDVVAGGTPVSGSVTLNGAGTVATFTPDAALAPSTTYTVTVSGATSLGGGVMTPVSWNFTTASAPVVTSQTPAPDATNIAVNATVAAGFDQAVTGATIVVSDPSATPVAGSTAYNASTNTATFTPSAPLSSATTYSVVASGATSAAGASMTPVTWSFTTLGSPSVTTRTPADGATGIALGTTVSAGFDRAVVAGSTTFQVVAGSTPVTGTLALNAAGTLATFTPSAALAPSTTYTVTVSGSASVGSGPMAPVSWTFTTAAQPMVITQSPAPGAVNVATNSKVSAGFDQAVTGATIVVKNPAGTTVAGSTIYTAATNTATFTPTAALALATTYTVTVSGATNAAGASMTLVTWSFTTPTPAPVVTTRSPATNATGVALGATVSAGFDRAVVNGSTVFQLVAGSTSITGTVTLNAAGTTATFTPATALAPSTTYTVTVSGAAAVGSPAMTPVSWNFTTAARPTVTSQSPATNAVNVSVSANVTVGFNQAVTGTTFAVTGPGGVAVTGTTTYNASTNVATFTPSAPWTSGTTYSVAASGATNAAGASMNPLSWSFTTAVAPSVTTQSPAANATGVAIGTKVSVTFDRAVVSGSTIIQLVGTSSVSGSLALTGSGTIATFTPSSALARNTTYTVTVSGATATGSGAMTPLTFTFTTAAAPTVISQSPTAGAIAVPTSSKVLAGFDQTVSGASITVKTASGSSVFGTTSFSSTTNTATFTPFFSLSTGTTYNVTVSGGATTAGGTMVPVSWSFTTTTTSPSVTTRTPASNATGVALGTTVSAGFDRAVVAGSTIMQLAAGGTPVSGTTTLNGAATTATFDPDVALTPSTTYTITVSGATAVGSAPMTPVSWNFTTAAPPTVTSQTPASNAVNVAQNATVALGFNQAVTGTTFAVTGPGGAVVTGTTTYNSGTNTATFTPSAQWSQASTYNVTASGATNTAGASMNPLSWSFATVGPPNVTVQSPAANASGVALSAKVSVTFDRTVTTGTTVIQVTSGGSVAGSTTLTGGTVATFTPSAALAPATTYTVNVSGAKAATGGAVMAPITWTFTTAPRPTVTMLTPAAGATNVPVNTNLSVAFSEPVTGETGGVTDPAGNAVAGTVTFDDPTNTATFTPTAPWNANTTYTISVSGGVNAAGVAMLPFAASFTTVGYGCPCQLFATSATPATPTVSDFSSSELGLRFKADVNGFVTGVRFYKGTSNTGTHVGSLWSNTGTLLGRVTFSGESSSGWQQANFSTPVAVTAGTLYVISYHANSGQYSQTANYFSGGGAMDSGPLHAPTGANGLLVHSSSSSFPSATSSSAANYFVDAVFTSASAPSVTSTTPTNGATGVSRTGNLTAQFNVPVQSSGLTFTLVTSGGSTVSGSVSLDSTGTIATFNPNSTLSSGTTYTASVRAKDSFGNQMVTPFTWTFRT